MEDRQAELLPVGYFHLVFTLPAQIANIAYQNKRVIYGLLFKAAAEAVLTIAADPKHLGAKVAITSVLHTWGSAMTHHPHIHMIVPGGGIAPDGSKWISCRTGFFLPVRVLSRLFRRFFCEMLVRAHVDGQLKFFGRHIGLKDRAKFERFLKPLRRTEWVVYAKPPFGGPEAVLAYLSRYIHRVAISNARLVSASGGAVTFKVKDYRVEGSARYKTMTLKPHEFIRRFLIHVLPKRFHRIRHYGLLANANRVANIKLARELLEASPNVPEPGEDQEPEASSTAIPACPCCGGQMTVIEIFQPGSVPRHKPQRAPPGQPGELL